MTPDGSPHQQKNRLQDFGHGGNQTPPGDANAPPSSRPQQHDLLDAVMNRTGPLGAGLNNPMNIGGQTGVWLASDLDLWGNPLGAAPIAGIDVVPSGGPESGKGVRKRKRGQEECREDSGNFWLLNGLLPLEHGRGPGHLVG